MTGPPVHDRPPVDAEISRGTNGGTRPPRTRTPSSLGNPLVLVGLAYALSWAWVIPLAVARATVVDGRGWPTHLPALLGPLRAAALCTALAGRRALQGLGTRMLRWRIGWLWWMAAVSPLLALLVVLSMLAVSGADLPPTSGFARFSGIPATRSGPSW